MIIFHTETYFYSSEVKCLQYFQQVCTRCSSDFGQTPPTPLSNMPAKVFSSVWVWRLAAPLQDLQMGLTEPLLGSPDCALWVIVMLQSQATRPFKYFLSLLCMYCQLLCSCEETEIKVRQFQIQSDKLSGNSVS